MTRERGAPGALLALAAVLVITAAWWALALWPLAADVPEWLARTRDVCFGTTDNGLPDVAGWTVLVLQPATMIGAVAVIWGRAVPDGLRGLTVTVGGRLLLAGAGLALSAGAALAGVRVANAAEWLGSHDPLAEAPIPSTYPRLDRPAPPLGLVDQRGDVVDLERFRGRTVLITFAFAHCETVCPMVVRDVLAARRRLAATQPVAAVIVTLDPWRDVPTRLPHIADRWSLGEDESVVSGTVAAVEAVLDAWGIPRRRDERTGDVTHPRLAYIVDGTGLIAYAANGGSQVLVTLAGRL